MKFNFLHLPTDGVPLVFPTGLNADIGLNIGDDSGEDGPLGAGPGVVIPLVGDVIPLDPIPFNSSENPDISKEEVRLIFRFGVETTSCEK